MLNLSVHIDQNSGFCFGVIYAIEMAEAVLEEKGYLYCLGDIVHNDEEISRLTKKGLKIIDYEQLKALKNEQVLIRAHGEPASTYELALKNNLELIDASCPVVLKLQNRIKNSFDKNEQILIYGKKGHAEVVGLMAQTNGEAIVFEDPEEIDYKTLSGNVTLYSQTTKSTHRFYSIKKRIETKGLQVNFNDTICRQVSNRDIQLKEFAKNYDKIVFVAGPKSSNGKMLYQVCCQSNPNSYFVSSVLDLQKEWFLPYETVGICGATSTPGWLMQEVGEFLQHL